jgi:hypothetical protein
VQPEPEPAPTEPVEETPAETPAPPPDEPKVEDPAPVEDLDLELRKAQEAEFEARAKHWEQVAGRHGSEIGTLRKTITDLQARLTQPAQEDGGYQDQPAPTPQATSDDPVRQWALQQAIHAATYQFGAAHPDANEMEAEIGQYLKNSGLGPLSDMTDPNAVQVEAQRRLDEAYWNVRAGREAARRAELTTKKAAQVAGLTAAKQRAATSGAGAPAPPRPVAKTPTEMSLAEMEAELKALTGGKWL